jgi:hypothetical protein
MRKPRDTSTSLSRAYNAEREALADKAKTLKARHTTQLGELILACKADVLSVEILAGALLAAADADAATKEVWRKRGAAFFSGASDARRSAGGKPGGAQAAGSEA